MSKDEIAIIRAKATTYAKTFLAHKYQEEYQELYDAYCRNRGVTTKLSRFTPIDERLVSKSEGDTNA
jgi:hypothetical protein